MAAKSSKVNAELEKAIEKLLKDVMKDPTATLTDKCKVLDRSLKLEHLKAKIDDQQYASAYNDDDD